MRRSFVFCIWSILFYWIRGGEGLLCFKCEWINGSSHQATRQCLPENFNERSAEVVNCTNSCLIFVNYKLEWKQNPKGDSRHQTRTMTHFARRCSSKPAELAADDNCLETGDHTTAIVRHCYCDQDYCNKGQATVSIHWLVYVAVVALVGMMMGFVVLLVYFVRKSGPGIGGGVGVGGGGGGGGAGESRSKLPDQKLGKPSDQSQQVKAKTKVTCEVKPCKMTQCQCIIGNTE